MFRARERKTIDVRLGVWVAALVLFYSGWLLIVVLGDHWQLLTANFRIAVAMVAGSYLAGSTPMGGGTVGFPVLTLWMNESAALGRDFSFAVQSIGMVSASLCILWQRTKINWPILNYAMLGSLISTPIGIVFLSPYIPDLGVKLFFAIVWASFGLLHFWKVDEVATFKEGTPVTPEDARRAGLMVGIIGGGLCASITGVGIDMLMYVVLVLSFRIDLKSAIPTSVLCMAFTSVVGVASLALVGQFQPRVFDNWLAASPVVAAIAPVGAMAVGKMDRRWTLLIVSALCLIQFVWTVFDEWNGVGWWGLSASLVAVGIILGVFGWIYERSAVPAPVPNSVEEA